MPNNTDNALRAAIRSMNDVIVPSINQADPLAKEQATLITQLLQFLRERAPYLQQRDRAELVMYHEMAIQLVEEIEELLPDRLEKFRHDLSQAERVCADPAPNPEDLTRLADELRSAISDLVQTSAGESEPLRTRIESVVIRGSKPVMELQRAWFLPTGMVPVDSSAPDLSELLKLSPGMLRP
jgi:hypothetical protein